MCFTNSLILPIALGSDFCATVYLGSIVYNIDITLKYMLEIGNIDVR